MSPCAECGSAHCTAPGDRQCLRRQLAAAKRAEQRWRKVATDLYKQGNASFDAVVQYEIAAGMADAATVEEFEKRNTKCAVVALAGKAPDAP